MDRVVTVDRKLKQVTVEAGCTISHLVEQLLPYGLTLSNFASIDEQQVGGFTQVGAHGTGPLIPPSDATVVRLKVVTPNLGTLELSANDEDPSLFYACRCALGTLGVVTEVTLQCVDSHRLEETTFVLSHAELREIHTMLLQSFQHLRYHWYPYTDQVAVAVSNPTHKSESEQDTDGTSSKGNPNQALVNLLKRRFPVCDEQSSQDETDSLPTLRSKLLNQELGFDPLDAAWISKVNQAEVAALRLAAGTRIGLSSDVLQFDCGGQQCVTEAAMSAENGKDLEFMFKLLKVPLQVHLMCTVNGKGASRDPLRCASEPLSLFSFGEVSSLSCQPGPL
jgi:L-galactono-1,4-lactone dehydrogenase